MRWACVLRSICYHMHMRVCMALWLFCVCMVRCAVTAMQFIDAVCRSFVRLLRCAHILPDVNVCLLCPVPVDDWGLFSDEGTKR